MFAKTREGRLATALRCSRVTSSPVGGNRGRGAGKAPGRQQARDLAESRQGPAESSRSRTGRKASSSGTLRRDSCGSASLVRASVLGAREQGRAFVGVAVDGRKAPGGVARAVVGSPPPEHPADVLRHLRHGTPHEASVRCLSDPLPDGRQGPPGRPTLEVPPPSPPPGLHLVAVKAQEVESLGTFGEADDPGLVRVQLKPQRTKDLLHPAPGLAGPDPARAEDDEVSAYLTSTP